MFYASWQRLSDKQAKAFGKARNYFEYADRHTSITGYRQKAVEDFGFYDGTKQWPAEVLAELAANGQPAITVNKIKNLVNYMAGVEIQTRFRVAFRSHSGTPEDDKLAKAITHLGYAIQENQDMPHKSSLKFRDALITGIGWSNIYKAPETGEIKYEYVNPLNVLFDPDDLSPDLSEMTFVARVRWIPLFKAEELWPKHKEYFKTNFPDRQLDAGSQSEELSQRQQGFIDLYSAGDVGSQSRLKVIEVQYKETEKAYQGIDLQGRYFQTFNEEEAYELKAEDSELEIKDATRIMRVLFTADMLLEYAPLDPILPNLPDFTYIPCIWSRRYEDGVPDGWISVMKDIQRESNYRRSKLVYNLNSFRVIYDRDAVSNLTDNDLVQILKRPGAAIPLSKPDARFDIVSNQPLAQGQFEMLERSDQELQQVSGIYDEALGNETNAQSGVAIQNRQINSVRNQVFAFDNLRMMKKREARMLMNLIQGGGDQFVESQILTEDEREVVLLNVVKTVNGKKIIFNDIRTLPLSIYVEEVPDFESSLQEQQTALQNLLSNPNALMIMQSPALLKRLGIRDYEALAGELSAILAQQQQNEQNIPQEGGGDAANLIASDSAAIQGQAA